MQDKYSGDSPVVKESSLLWAEFPPFPTGYIMSVKETLIEREDNIFAQIGSLTSQEDAAFRITAQAAPMFLGPNERLSL